MILIYDSITGETMKLAKRFGIQSRDLQNYDGNDYDIVIIGRKLLEDENLWDLTSFIKKFKKKIIGVIIYDDKMFGDEFGKSAQFYTKEGVKIIAVWDKIISDKEIMEMEAELYEKTR